MESTAALGRHLLQLAPKSTACLRVCTQNSDVRHSGHRAPPTRQGDKATASHHESGQARTRDGAGDGHAVEHKGRVKRPLASDVSADPQPVGVQKLISCPALKIGETGGERRSRRHDRPRCGEPQKIAGRCQFDLRYEKVLTRSQIEWGCKLDRDFRFLPGYRTVAA